MKQLFTAVVLLSIAFMGARGQAKKVAATDLPDAPSKSKANVNSQPSTAQTPATTSGGLPTQEGWPKEITNGPNRFTVYQPQLDSWNDNTIEARSAVAVTAGSSARTNYGVIWFSAHTQIDKQNRNGHLD